MSSSYLPEHLQGRPVTDPEVQAYWKSCIAERKAADVLEDEIAVLRARIAFDCRGNQELRDAADAAVEIYKAKAIETRRASRVKVLEAEAESSRQADARIDAARCECGKYNCKFIACNRAYRRKQYSKHFKNQFQEHEKRIAAQNQDLQHELALARLSSHSQQRGAWNEEAAELRAEVPLGSDDLYREYRYDYSLEQVFERRMMYG